MVVSFKTYIFLEESLGTDITKEFLRLFSNFKVNMKKDNRTIHFVLDSLDLDGIIESIKTFFKKQGAKQSKVDSDKILSYILGTTLVDIFKPKKTGRKIELDVQFN